MAVRQEYPANCWAPAPGARAAGRRIISQARFDLAGVLRNGEQLLLTLIIPLVLLVAASSFSFVSSADGEPIDTVTPGILALAVMSTAFTSLAISVGFDRRSGALRLLATTPLTRRDLLLARTLSVVAVEAMQVVLIALVAFGLGWSPLGSIPSAIALLLLGTAAFACCGVALAGVLRAEATLAVANGIYLLLLIGGGTVVPLDKLPAPLATVASLLPSGALGEGLRSVLTDGAAVGLQPVLVLIGWTVFGAVVTVRTFRWN
ncbi:MAG TPA: ABC transporter permease [Actinomycetota bacterium]|nr:ABC transporter permease [Actinomycetota bacterium]